MVSTIYTLRTNSTPASVSALNLELEAWANDLPQPLRITHFLAVTPAPTVIMLQLNFEKDIVCLLLSDFSLSFMTLTIQDKILLHRPFYHEESAVADFSVKKCDASAWKVVKLVQLYDSVYGLSYIPLTAMQTIFLAATVLLLGARKSAARAAKRTRTSIEGFRVCVDALIKIAECWNCAKPKPRTLLDLCEKWLPGWLDDSISLPQDTSTASRKASASQPPLLPTDTFAHPEQPQPSPPLHHRSDSFDYSWIQGLQTINPASLDLHHPIAPPQSLFSSSAIYHPPPLPETPLATPPLETSWIPGPGSGAGVKTPAGQAHIQEMFELAAMQMQMVPPPASFAYSPPVGLEGMDPSLLDPYRKGT
ncbi:hypothetical protein MNV49_007493 [Pseudohyphozyma bogoriensis]|nr:hypothetical protein MNV49_007493 [Pseudohyphozyma bogoriensis]